MASVGRIEGPRGTRWQVRYRRPNGRQAAQNFDRAGAAREFAASVEHERRTGAYIDPAGPRTPFRQVAAKWQATAGHKDLTAATRGADLKNHVLPVLGVYRIGAITPVELRGLLRTLEAKGLAAATIAKVFGAVTAVFAFAVEAGILTRSPAQGLTPAKGPRRVRVRLDGDQVEAVLAELTPHYRAAAILAADAGLRLGEVFGLTADRVGLRVLARSRTIHVERQLVTLAGTDRYLRLPKGDKVRAVPVGESVTDALAEHMARHRRATAPDRVSGGSVELVFATEDGTPVGRGAVGPAFRGAVRRAGLPTGTRFHDLRHYYASVLIDAGLSEREIGERLGHSSLEVTAGYGDLFDHADDRTRHAVEASVERRRAAK